MDNSAPLQLIPDDIQVDELMGQEDLQAPDPNQIAGAKNNVQNVQNVGFVEFLLPSADPIFLSRQSQSLTKFRVFKHILEAITLWAKCFAPGPGAPTVHIRRKWTDFFTLLLSSPEAHLWAKQFLGSPALPLLNEHPPSMNIPFYLPQSLPDVEQVLCSKNLPTELSFVPT